jgi:SAM-dependent methyltransferase
VSRERGRGAWAELPSAVRAFDRTAVEFDHRFGGWRSVAAQRAAVRRYLLKLFPSGSRLLELGAGTGEDALFLLERGYQVTVTDGSPRMVEIATRKVRAAGFAPTAAPVEQLVLEQIGNYADSGAGAYDGVYSNFAALNCLPDLGILAEPLARLVRPGGRLALVVFGPWSVGEVVVELLRGRPSAAFRRFRRGAAGARLGGESFDVWYPTPRAVARALSPHFQWRGVRGIGILVPPSAAEPWISGFPWIVSSLEAADRLLSAPLALLADHVLIRLDRTAHTAP